MQCLAGAFGIEPTKHKRFHRNRIVSIRRPQGWGHATGKPSCRMACCRFRQNRSLCLCLSGASYRSGSLTLAPQSPLSRHALPAKVPNMGAGRCGCRLGPGLCRQDQRGSCQRWRQNRAGLRAEACSVQLSQVCLGYDDGAAYLDWTTNPYFGAVPWRDHRPQEESLAMRFCCYR